MRACCCSFNLSAIKQRPSIADLIGVDSDHYRRFGYAIPTDIPYPDDSYLKLTDVPKNGNRRLSLPVTTRLPIASNSYAIEATPCFVSRSPYHCWLDNPNEMHIGRAHFQRKRIARHRRNGLSWTSRVPAFYKKDILLFGARDYESRYGTLRSYF